MRIRRARTYKLFRETKTKALNITTSLIMVASSLGGALPLFFVHGASALSTTIASPSNTQGWATQDGAPSYVAGPNGADGYGSLQFSTTSSTSSKENYFHAANTPLAGISGLGYKVDVTAGIPASYQLQVTGVHRTDSSSTFTSLVWEPVYNGQVNGPNGGFVTESNLENGVWWSSHPIDGAPYNNGNPTYVSLSQIQAANPGATIVAYGANVGSGTPNATSYVDDVSFQSDVTNFETDAPAAPTALGYHYTADDQHDNAASLACGAVVNSNKPSTYHTSGSLNLTWTAPAGDVSGYQVQTTYPDGTPFDQNNDGYQGPNNWSWLSFTHGEGTYTYQVRARNTAGQWSAYSTPCSIVYDKTAPVVTVTPTAGSLLSGTVTFTITVTDTNLAHNGAKTWVYLYDNGGTQKSKGASVDLSNGSGTFTVDTTQLDDGLATLDVGKLYDAAGNASGTGDSYFKNYVIDNTAPTLPSLLTPPNNGYETTNDFYFTWTPSTDASPVTYEFQSDNDGSFTSPWDSITNGNSEQNNLTTPKIHSTGAPDGAYYWRVRAIDAAGNKSAWTGAWKMTIDTQAPTALITSPSNNQLVSTRATSGKLNLTGTASDNDFNYYYCYVTDTHGEVGTRSSQCVTAWAAGTPFQSAFAQTAQGTTNGSLGYVDMTGLGDGNYTVHLVAKDKAGNTTEATQPFVLDNTRPSLSFTAPANFAAFYQTGPTVKVSGSDAHGLSTLIIHVYNASTNQLLASPSCTATSAELASGQLSCDLSGLADGTYYVKAGANDTAGNNQTITSPSFTVDHTAPVVAITAPHNGDTLHGTVTVSGSVNDTNPDHYYFVVKDSHGHVVAGPGTVNQATVSDWNWNTKNVADGTYTIDLEARDKAGNKDAGSIQTITVTVDNSAPTGLINLSPSNGAITNTASLTHVDWTDATDANGPVAYYYEVSNSPATNADGSFVSPVYQSGALIDSQISTPNTPAGHYYWHVRAVDSLSNSTPWTAAWSFTIDNTAPVVTVDTLSTTDTTPTLTGTVDDSSASVSVKVNGHTYAATVTGNTWSADVTDALPVGTYDVVATATDTAGNIGTDGTTNELTITAPAPQNQSNNNVTITNFSRQVATTGNANNNGNTTGGNAQTGNATNGNGTVLGASTNTGSNGQVKGDSTVNLQNASDKKSNFLVLGWWWLAIIAALGLGWFLLAAYRRSERD